MEETHDLPEVQNEALRFFVEEVRRSGKFQVTPVTDTSRHATFSAPVPPQRLSSRDIAKQHHSTPADKSPRRPPPPVFDTSFIPYLERDFLAKSLRVPKLPDFSGGSSGDDFDIWVYDVNCLLRSRSYPNQAILEAIRKSLKGKARTVLLHLGEYATIEEIVNELEGLYGNVASCEKLKEKFYSAYQEKAESVADYSLRLEQLLRHTNIGIDQYSKNAMLKNL